jgi:hypothetical protein
MSQAILGKRLIPNRVRDLTVFMALLKTLRSLSFKFDPKRESVILGYSSPRLKI